MADLFDAVEEVPEIAGIAVEERGNITSSRYGSLAPQALRFWRSCTSDPPRGNPSEFITGWTLGALCAVLGCALSIQHLRALGRMPFSTRRSLSMGICRQPLVFGIACTLGMVVPRGSFLWLELMQIYEALAVFWFGELMLMLIFEHEELEIRHAALARQNSRSFWASRGGYLEVVATVLSRQEPRKLLASPPLGCCFSLTPWLPCGKKLKATPALLGFVRNLLRAFVVGLPTLAIVRLWAREAYGWRTPSAGTVAAEQIFSAAEILLTLSALYALVILYRACQPLMGHHRITLKFMAVKLILILSNLQKLVLSLWLRAANKDDADFCLSPASHAAWLQYVLLLVELPIVATVHRLAYPTAELEDPSRNKARAATVGMLTGGGGGGGGLSPRGGGGSPSRLSSCELSAAQRAESDKMPSPLGANARRSGADAEVGAEGSGGGGSVEMVETTAAPDSPRPAKAKAAKAEKPGARLLPASPPRSDAGAGSE